MNTAWFSVCGIVKHRDVIRHIIKHVTTVKNPENVEDVELFVPRASKGRRNLINTTFI